MAEGNLTRRKHKHLDPVNLALVLMGSFGGVWIIQRELVLVLLLASVAGAYFVAVKLFFPARRRGAILERSDAIIDRHADQLARRRAQLVRPDAYGKPLVDKWLAEIEHFTVHHIRPSLTPSEQSFFDRRRAELFQLISGRVEAIVAERPVFEAFTDSMTPSEFEFFCAEQLRKFGWNSRVTQQSRDQGVDVIAEKDNSRVVLQCKLYSNPVGNKAVQEIVAGRAHEQAHYGAVVTNATYTVAAEELALTNGILLLHYSDLPHLEALLARPAPLKGASLAQSSGK